MNDMYENVAERNSHYYSALAMRAKYNKYAFEELYDYFFPRVYSFIYARMKNADAADDVVSIAFEKMLLKLCDYDIDRGAFSTWLFRIASNCMTDYYRKQSRNNEAQWEEFFDPADERATPEQETLKKEGASEVLKALDKLSEREKNIVTLKYFSGLSNKEIAEAEGMSANNVGVILHRSLSKLKGLLEDYGK